jgi:hypothetical protein
MSVRKTESRIPAGFQASDLGEAIVSTDGHCTLVSFISAPLTGGHENTYVVFVTDPGLASSVQSYEWAFSEDGAFPLVQSTEVGETTYQTGNIGNLTLTVTLLDSTETELTSLSIIQEVGQLNPDLETQIEAAIGQPGAGASNLDVIREIVNDYYSYYQAVTLQNPEGDDSFKRFVCNYLFDGALKNTHKERLDLFTAIATALESNPDAFEVSAAAGLGVCDIRPALLAMIYPTGSPLLPWTELPEPSDQNALADEQLRQKLAGLNEPDKIDLVNIARFPKTGIIYCAKILETLRDKYFTGTSFKDVISGMNGTRSHWIEKHYSKGPIAHS